MSIKISRRTRRWPSKLNKASLFLLGGISIAICVLTKIFQYYYFFPISGSTLTVPTEKPTQFITLSDSLTTKPSKVTKFTYHSTAEVNKALHNSGSDSANVEQVTLVIILCNDGKKQKQSVKATLPILNQTFIGELNGTKPAKNLPNKKPIRDFDRQINQTIVLLKSIALQQQFTSGASNKQWQNCSGFKNLKGQQSSVNILVLSDDKVNYDRVLHAIDKEQWSNDFTRWLNLTFVPVSYPPGSQWMRKLFRPCATLRLFLAELLPQYDSVVYLDTDIIFLRNVMDLWEQFKGFSSNKTFAAMAPCLNHYQTRANHVPFYGKTGLNAGIMLMNLTRIRSSGWTEKILEVTSAFQNKITLADQDILNIYFSSNPAEVHELTCDWNFRPFQCRKGSFCQDFSLAQGISALHGNALSFTSEGPEPLFHAVFSAYQNLNLTQCSTNVMKKLIKSIHSRLSKVQGRSRSDCSHFGAFSILLLSRMIPLV